MQTKQVVVNDLLTRYCESGQGETILLLHGWGDNCESYKDLQADLSKSYQVFSLDLPGFGKTQAPPTAWGLDDYAQFVCDFLAKLGVSELHGLLGHSNGGAIAIKLAAGGKLPIEKLVLLGSAGIRTQSVKKVALKLAAKTAKIVTKPLPKATQKKIRTTLYDKMGSEFMLVPHMQDTFKKIIDEDISRLAGHITQPTLLIYGENDTATPPAFGRQFAHVIQNSRLEIVAGAGHFVHHDAHDEVSKLVEEFLA